MLDPKKSNTMTMEDIPRIKYALEEAVDSITRTVDKEAKKSFYVFIVELITTPKLTYFLTPANIRSLLNDYISRDPYRFYIEDMTVRFLAHLSSVDELRPRLINTLATALSAHNNSPLLPADIVDLTVSQDKTVKVLEENTWLLFMVALITYYTTDMLSDAEARSKGG